MTTRSDHAPLPRAGAASSTVRRRRWLVLCLGAELVLLTALTLWLFPSVWAGGYAVFDVDQSAGAERGVVLSEVANHPEVMWDRSVTISAEVADLLDPRTMIIGNDALFRGDEVLVVGGAALDALLDAPATGPIAEGDVARVTGIVRRFEPAALAAELGVDPATLERAGYDGPSALVAHSIALNPGVIGPGDKEFLAGSSGYEIGVTINDVVTRTDEFLGTVVSVSDEVDEPDVGPHAFVLGDEQLLAVAVGPTADPFIEQTAYVTGEVRRFDLPAVEAELRIDLDDERLSPFAGEPVIIARSVELVA